MIDYNIEYFFANRCYRKNAQLHDKCIVAPRYDTRNEKHW